MNVTVELGKNSLAQVYRKTYFVGQCYKCGSWKHPQDYCPLQFCSLCTHYGHHQKVCKKKNHTNKKSTLRCYVMGKNHVSPNKYKKKIT